MKKRVYESCRFYGHVLCQGRYKKKSMRQSEPRVALFDKEVLQSIIIHIKIMANIPINQGLSMQKKNNISVGVMAQRCHKWRQKRKQLLEQARGAFDPIEKEKILQAAEHYGRMVNDEQSKIDLKRGPREIDVDNVEDSDFESDEDITIVES